MALDFGGFCGKMSSDTQSLVIAVCLTSIQIGLGGSGIPHGIFAVPPTMFGALHNELIDEKELAREITVLLRTSLANCFITKLQRFRALVVEPPHGLPTLVKQAFTDVLKGSIGVGGLSFLPSCLAEVVSGGAYTGLCVSIGAHETVVTPVVHGVPLSQAVVPQLPMGSIAVEACVALRLIEGLALHILPSVEDDDKATFAERRALGGAAAMTQYAALCNSSNDSSDDCSVAREVIQWVRRLVHSSPEPICSAAESEGTCQQQIIIPSSLFSTMGLSTVVKPGMSSQKEGSTLSVAGDATNAKPSSGKKASSVPPVAKLTLSSGFGVDGGDGSEPATCGCASCVAAFIFCAQSSSPTGAASSSILRQLIESSFLRRLEAARSNASEAGRVASQLGALASLCKALLLSSLPDVGHSLGSSVLESLRHCPVDTRRVLAANIVISASPPALLPRGCSVPALSGARHWHKAIAAGLMRELKWHLTAANGVPVRRYRMLAPLLPRFSIANTVPPSCAMWAGASAMGRLKSDLCKLSPTAMEVAAQAALGLGSNGVTSAELSSSAAHALVPPTPSAAAAQTPSAKPMTSAPAPGAAVSKPAVAGGGLAGLRKLQAALKGSAAAAAPPSEATSAIKPPLAGSASGSGSKGGGLAAPSTELRPLRPQASVAAAATPSVSVSSSGSVSASASVAPIIGASSQDQESAGGSKPPSSAAPVPAAAPSAAANLARLRAKLKGGPGAAGTGGK